MDADRNAGWLLLANGTPQELPEMDKRAFADKILDAVAGLLAARAG
jgi:phosphopantothenoylcysteine synthetase/decarboxylase